MGFGVTQQKQAIRWQKLLQILAFEPARSSSRRRVAPNHVMKRLPYAIRKSKK